MVYHFHIRKWHLYRTPCTWSRLFALPKLVLLLHIFCYSPWEPILCIFARLRPFRRAHKATVLNSFPFLSLSVTLILQLPNVPHPESLVSAHGRQRDVLVRLLLISIVTLSFICYFLHWDLLFGFKRLCRSSYFYFCLFLSRHTGLYGLLTFQLSFSLWWWNIIL